MDALIADVCLDGLREIVTSFDEAANGENKCVLHVMARIHEALGSTKELGW